MWLRLSFFRRHTSSPSPGLHFQRVDRGKDVGRQSLHPGKFFHAELLYSRLTALFYRELLSQRQGKVKWGAGTAGILVGFQEYASKILDIAEIL